MLDGTQRPTVAIAGATGFVGQALRRALVDTCHVIGLTRSPTRAALPDADGVTWRGCDLFAIDEVARALQGVDVAIYLVHSMLPSARLTQATFSDMDLLLADSFARAAAQAGVKQLLYLGGVMPRDGAPLSEHLRSREEVERALAARGVPVTVLRAGLILGPGGSSMSMMVNLVRRLPAMALPAWTRAESCPLYIDDVVRAVRLCLGNPRTLGQQFELGGPDTLTYREMLERTARVMGLSRPSVDVPFMTPRLSTLWVSVVSGYSEALVGPLIESLRHSVVPAPSWLHDEVLQGAVPFDEALRRSLDAQGRPLPNPRSELRAPDDRRLKASRTVRSIQRMPLPPGRDARWVAQEYLRWLPGFVWPLLRCRVEEERRARFFLSSSGLELLQLTTDEAGSTPDRHVFTITGGNLADAGGPAPGWFEFREVLGGAHVIAAIHDFRPALPWYLYNLSQAQVHLWVMEGFRRHLEALASATPGDAQPQAS